MIKKIEGIVVSERSYQDSSKIIKVLTPDFGIIDVLAKGAKGLKSPLRSGTQKLTRGNFYVYYKEDKLSTLSNVDILSQYKNILKDITKITYASYLLDLSYQVMRQNPKKEIYHLLINLLEKIEEGFSPSLLANILELQYLTYLGVRPVIDCCSICGSKQDIITLSSNRGGLICKNCYSDEIILQEKTIKLVRMFYYVDISKITKLEIGEDVQKELNQFIDEYYEQYTGLSLKTKSMLKNLNRIA